MEQHTWTTFSYTGTTRTSFTKAQRLAEERNSGPDARYRLRIDFSNMYRLAHADRPCKGHAPRFCATRDAPPVERLENSGVDVHLFDRINPEHGEQEIPDRLLQLRMLEDTVDYMDEPGLVVLLTGDGAGYSEGAGFHRTLERMHNRGWRIEILSWAHSCNRRMRLWAQENGVFVALDDFYDSVTFLEPSRPRTSTGRIHAILRNLTFRCALLPD